MLKKVFYSIIGVIGVTSYVGMCGYYPITGDFGEEIFKLFMIGFFGAAWIVMVILTLQTIWDW